VLACDDVCLAIEERDSVGIVGESGSGKTTLAMSILGLLPAKVARVEGTIRFLGRELVGRTSQELSDIRWEKMAAVFQKSMSALSPVHKIGYQFQNAYRVHRPKATRTACRALADTLFAKVNLPSRVYDLYPHQLSGGMLQRVSIALSLMFSPMLVILDEAATALDVVTEGQILREIVRLQEAERMAQVTITHNMAVVSSCCQRVLVMYAGRILEFGRTVEILLRPRHPYTMGLMRSFPSFTKTKGNLRGIPGSLPDLSAPISGCVFADRCGRSQERCKMERPPLRQIQPGWDVACFYPEDGIV